jgi:cardiolipin synthase
MKKREGGKTLRAATRSQIEDHNTPSLSVSSFYKHVPNILTILRLLGTPLILWVIAKDELIAAFWIFFAICITDWLDGYLARRWQATSKLGQILDPLADKFLLLSVYLTLALFNLIPMWLTVLVVIRDFLILTIGSGIILSRNLNISLAPQFMGKISTTLQMLFIGFVLIEGIPVLSIPSSIKDILMVSFLYSVTVTTILSGVMYAQVAFKAFRKKL